MQLVNVVLTGGPFNGRRFRIRSEEERIETPTLEPNWPPKKAVYHKSKTDPNAFEYVTTICRKESQQT